MGWLGLCLLALLAGGGWLHRWRREAKVELARLEQKRAERDQLVRSAPAPDESGRSAVSAEVTAAEEKLEWLRASLAGRGGDVFAGQPVPVDSVAAWSELTAFVERMRALAANQRVALVSGECLGFATYAHKGPEPDLLAAVHRQQVLAEKLLTILCQARPHELCAFQREKPRGPVVAKPVRPEEVAADFFVPDERIALRRPGFLEGELFRLEFTGQTETLRAFLTGLASSPWPFAARSVEVAPREGKAVRAAPETGGAARPALLVTREPVRFVVVVEFVQPAAALAGTASPSAVVEAESRPPVWPVPLAQSRGEAWRYELFTPPDIHFDGVAYSLAPVRQGADEEGGTGKAEAPDRPGFELLTVKREPFRLQLAGYAGAPGDYLATFMNPRSGEIYLARPGHRFAELGLRFERFEPPRPSAAMADGQPAGAAAQAVLHDEITGEEITLNDDTRRFTATPLAVLRIGPATARPRELRAGDTWRVRDEVYRIEHIQLVPPEVVVSRQASGSSPAEMRKLHPGAVADEHKFTGRSASPVETHSGPVHAGERE